MKISKVYIKEQILSNNISVWAIVDESKCEVSSLIASSNKKLSYHSELCYVIPWLHTVIVLTYKL